MLLLTVSLHQIYYPGAPQPIQCTLHTRSPQYTSSSPIQLHHTRLHHCFIFTPSLITDRPHCSLLIANHFHPLPLISFFVTDLLHRPPAADILRHRSSSRPPTAAHLQFPASAVCRHLRSQQPQHFDCITWLYGYMDPIVSK
ncbi:hypothetical protein ACOSQ2_011907 [Xanthoceras sorbifolium]